MATSVVVLLTGTISTDVATVVKVFMETALCRFTSDLTQVETDVF